MLVQSISELIGNTPTLRCKKFEKAHQLNAKIYTKLESMNPSGSTKDRIAMSMIKTAEQSGCLEPGSTIIEASCGNFAISLSFVCNLLGYKCTIVMPKDYSNTKEILETYGATVILSDSKGGIKQARIMAQDIADNTANSYVLNQYDNPSNPQAHRLTTAHEILSDIPNIDILLCGIGTGGTITGVGEELKRFNPNVQVIAVEPLETNPLMSIQLFGTPGLTSGVTSSVVNLDVIDYTMQVSTADSIEFMKDFLQTEGVLVGVSSGAILYSASTIAKKKENENKNIALILPDAGLRYLDFFKDTGVNHKSN